jgi:hypothetical protein
VKENLMNDSPSLANPLAAPLLSSQAVIMRSPATKLAANGIDADTIAAVGTILESLRPAVMGTKSPE